jgi:azurin
MLYFKNFNNISIVAHMYKFICEFPLHAAIVHGPVQQSIIKYLIN